MSSALQAVNTVRQRGAECRTVQFEGSSLLGRRMVKFLFLFSFSRPWTYFPVTLDSFESLRKLSSSPKLVWSKILRDDSTYAKLILRFDKWYQTLVFPPGALKTCQTFLTFSFVKSLKSTRVPKTLYYNRSRKQSQEGPAPLTSIYFGDCLKFLESSATVRSSENWPYNS